jgi:polysaccharide pyruvyl transferase WcaK-like protein
MNSDQYGFSDLGLAYRLQKLLPAGFPLAVWETEPDVDAVTGFLGRMDAVVAMRFHAGIFALAAGVPTIGIDYSHGRPGKVSELFAGLNLGQSVCRVDGFTADWLVERLEGLLVGHQVKAVR